MKRRTRLLSQGLYYLATGLWPLVHMRSFLAVTGPKTDLWLVRTVGLLAIAAGLPLVREGLRGDGDRRGRDDDEVAPDVALLGRATAAAFIAAEVPHVLAGRISPVYLLDAAVEAAFRPR